MNIKKYLWHYCRSMVKVCYYCVLYKLYDVVILVILVLTVTLYTLVLAKYYTYDNFCLAI